MAKKKKPDKAKYRSFYDGITAQTKRLQLLAEEPKPETIAPVEASSDSADAEEASRTRRRQARSSILERLNQAVSDKNWDQALKVCLALSRAAGTPFRVKSQLLAMSTALRKLGRHSSKVFVLSSNELSHTRTQLADTLSNINYFMTGGDERETAKLTREYDSLAVALPADVGRSTHVDDVPIVCTSSAYLASSETVTHVIDNMYIIRCTLVGVPYSDNDQKNLERASKYALNHFRALPCPLPLSRPDSEGVWFVIAPGTVLDFVCFPEMLRRSPVESEAIRRVIFRERLGRQRSERFSFEQENAADLVKLEQLRDEKTSLAFQADKIRDTFVNATGRSPRSIREIALRDLVAKKKENELASESRFDLRYNIIKGWDSYQLELLSMRESYLDHRGAIRSINRQILEIEEKLANRREDFRLGSTKRAV